MKTLVLSFFSFIILSSCHSSNIKETGGASFDISFEKKLTSKELKNAVEVLESVFELNNIENPVIKISNDNQSLRVELPGIDKKETIENILLDMGNVSFHEIYKFKDFVSVWEALNIRISKDSSIVNSIKEECNCRIYDSLSPLSALLEFNTSSVDGNEPELAFVSPLYKEFLETLFQKPEIKGCFPRQSSLRFQMTYPYGEDKDGKYRIIGLKGEPAMICNTFSDVTFETVNDDYGKYQVIHISFTPDDAKKFSELSGRLVKEFLSIEINGKIVSIPVIQDRIDGGKVDITSGVDDSDFAQLCGKLKLTLLPATFSFNNIEIYEPKK